MKKFKWFLIIAGVLCGIGILLCLVCGTVLGWNLTRLDLSPDMERAEYSVPGMEVQEIYIDAANYRVAIVQSADMHIHLLYNKNEDITCEVTNTDGKLSLIYKEQGSLKNIAQMFRGLKGIGNIITVQLPSGYVGTVTAVNANGEITAENLRIGGKLALRTENARILLEDMQCGEIVAVSNNGSIKAEEIRTEQTVDLQSQNSGISLDTVYGRNLLLTTDNGGIEAEESTAVEEAKLRAGNGAIRVDQIFAADLSFETSNGSVSGTINGKKQDFQIAHSVENGSSNLENRLDQSAPYLLQLHIENGSVKLYFEKDDDGFDD